MPYVLQSSRNLLQSTRQLSGRFKYLVGQKYILLDNAYFLHWDLEIFCRKLSDSVEFSARQNEILLVLSDRPALFAKTGVALCKSCHCSLQ